MWSARHRNGPTTAGTAIYYKARRPTARHRRAAIAVGASPAAVPGSAIQTSPTLTRAAARPAQAPGTGLTGSGSPGHLALRADLDREPDLRSMTAVRPMRRPGPRFATAALRPTPAVSFAQEAGAAGWLGECDISVSLLPSPFATVRQEGANTGRLRWLVRSPVAPRALLRQTQLATLARRINRGVGAVVDIWTSRFERSRESPLEFGNRRAWVN